MKKEKALKIKEYLQQRKIGFCFLKTGELITLEKLENIINN